jgi:N-methylhydantoinase A
VSHGVRIAVDIGGTFTDVVAVANDRVVTTKVLSTPNDLSQAVVEGIQEALTELKATPADIAFVVHATTVATNALLERKGGKVGLLVTEGFRDILEIGRQRRSDPYDLKAPKLPALVSREFVVEIPERIDAGGRTVVGLDEFAVAEGYRRLAGLGVNAVAISFLHSYVSPGHERRALEVLESLESNGCAFFASHEVLPEAREYERTSTTVIAAYLSPVVGSYLDTLSRRLESIGAPGRFWVMKSSGGLVSSEIAARHPEQFVESGPAAGVIGAAASSRWLQNPNIISFDMGGTTAKASLVLGAKPRLNLEYEVGGGSHAGGFLQKGTGYPLRVPVVDLAEVGTGGGSIAWIDAAGALRVGPHSAEADPGPACYRRGGTEPTVTDADLALGFLDETGSGHIGRLDLVAARETIRNTISAPLGISVESAARGIFELANSQMADAVRLVSIAKGYDPRDFVLIPFGGAGPVHAWAIAQDLAIGHILVPPFPGVHSAVGLLSADFRVDLSQGLRLALSAPGSASEIGSVLVRLAEQARREIAEQGHDMACLRLSFSADMRYVGQSYEVNVDFKHDTTQPVCIESLEHAFHHAHERAYGHSSPRERVEVIVLRATATVAASDLHLKPVTTFAGGGMRRRLMHFGDTPENCRIIGRGEVTETGVSGPLAIQQADTTTIVPPKAAAKRAAGGFLAIEFQRGEAT